nr:hypothetical protein Itr_chr12CG04310 [Ipomoea trifida]
MGYRCGDRWWRWRRFGQVWGAMATGSNVWRIRWMARRRRWKLSVEIDSWLSSDDGISVWRSMATIWLGLGCGGGTGHDDYDDLARFGVQRQMTRR